MNTEADVQEQEQGAETTTESVSILDRAIGATSQTSPDTTKELMSELTRQALEGTVTWDKNLTLTMEKAITAIDVKISEQLSMVLHDASFQKLEGSWRGLQKLIRNTELGPDLKIRISDYTRDELLEQFEDAPAIDRSRFFNMIYQEEFGTAGGEPFGALLGDYAFSYGDEDVALLRYMGEVAAAAHAPFISAISPAMFDFAGFETFYEGKPVAAGFDAPAYGAWNAFRDSDDARYVALTLPRTMARLPYGAETMPVKAFAFEEFASDADGHRHPDSGKSFVWSNACYEYGLLLTQAFTRFGWCTAVRGMENGGKVENLPLYSYTTPAGERVVWSPTEINFTDEREKELSDLGFLPLVHYKNTNFAVFMGGQTAQRPKTYTYPDATSNAAISARLPYIMASSRIAHYLKMIGRDRIGSHMEPEDVEKQLNEWIGQYVNPNAIGNEAKAKHPLREASIKVQEQTGRPGCYSAVAYMRPWLQMEELTTSLRMVARIPG